MPPIKRTYFFCRVFFDYFRNPIITNILRRMNGAEIIIFHQKLIMHTTNTGNIYCYYGDDNDADHVEEIAYDLRVDPKVVKEGLEVLYRYGLIDHHPNGIYVPLLPELIDVGKTTSDAIIKAKQRNKIEKKVDNVHPDVHPDKELKLKLNVDIDNDDADAIITSYNSIFPRQFRKNKTNKKTISKALTRINKEQAEQIIKNEYSMYSRRERGDFYPNITWMFGQGLEECLDALTDKKNRKTKNQFCNFEQRNYDFSEIENELIDN